VIAIVANDFLVVIVLFLWVRWSCNSLCAYIWICL